ncbi:hypothetical protein F444_19239 [Phytophthora nicotianae P1976]|uniref:Uncharacterized protein n=1 Tax=Phytophthora nicotianae P1976 TaxID=1317066 RepID=A0A080Z8H9_PHYNI|nr:hypothetical protein F444_19239 [Phytophthora nicotianae P1976]
MSKKSLGRMQSLPFRLLVVNELNLQSDRHNWQLPGVVAESECGPLWKSKPEPLIWEARSLERLDLSRDLDSRIVYLDVPDCSFIKLVVYAPFKSNLTQQVVLEDVELLGSTKDSSVAQELHAVKHDNDQINYGFSVINRPMILPPANDYDELQAVLLDAGVPMDLVVQISNMSRDDEILLQPTGEVIPELRSPSNTSRAISGNGTVISEERDSRTNDEKDVTSPFESALRQYLEQSARERSMLEKIFATNISTSTVDVSSWQPPTNSPTDPANSNEITLYTFGTFFTQCLFCGGPDIQVTCIQMAERTAPLVKKVIGATCAFEGIVALIVVGIREAKTSQVFQTAIHLAYTVFLTETASTKKMSEHGEDEHCGGVSALNLIEEVACPNWSYGLRVILEWALVSSFCWSIGKPTLLKMNRNFERMGRLSKTPQSVDRGFLQFIRLMVDQDLTRTVFFDELVDSTPTSNTTGLNFARNRLRLLRLITRNDLIRCQVPANTKESIHTLCSTVLCLHSQQSDEMTLKRDDNDIMIRLASECLATLDRPASSGRQLEGSNNTDRHHSNHYSHTALFVQDALLNAETTAFTSQLQRYFSFQPRPTGLYRHSFVRANAKASKDGLPDTCESFQKGNIAFQGQVGARIPPTTTFHDEIQRKTAPFVFDIGAKKSTAGMSSLPVGKQDVVSNFASFKGTIERRSDPPKRYNKVSPEQDMQTPSSAKASITTTSKPHITTVDNNTVKVLPSRLSGLQGPTEESSSIPDIMTVNRAPTTLNCTPTATMGPRAATPTAANPPVSIPGNSALNRKQPEDIKQLVNTRSTDQPERRTGGVNGKSKEKVKSNSKHDGKDPDHCVVQ